MKDSLICFSLLPISQPLLSTNFILCRLGLGPLTEVCVVEKRLQGHVSHVIPQYSQFEH